MIVMIVSGLQLQSKKHWAWVQPKEVRGTGTEPAIDLTASSWRWAPFPT
jgi:hypothetical protein